MIHTHTVREALKTPASTAILFRCPRFRFQKWAFIQFFAASSPSLFGDPLQKPVQLVHHNVLSLPSSTLYPPHSTLAGSMQPFQANSSSARPPHPTPKEEDDSSLLLLHRRRAFTLPSSLASLLPHRRQRRDAAVEAVQLMRDRLQALGFLKGGGFGGRGSSRWRKAITAAAAAHIDESNENHNSSSDNDRSVSSSGSSSSTSDEQLESPNPKLFEATTTTTTNASPAAHNLSPLLEPNDKHSNDDKEEDLATSTTVQWPFLPKHTTHSPSSNPPSPSSTASSMSSVAQNTLLYMPEEPIVTNEKASSLSTSPPTLLLPSSPSASSSSSSSSSSFSSSSYPPPPRLIQPTLPRRPEAYFDLISRLDNATKQALDLYGELLAVVEKEKQQSSRLIYLATNTSAAVRLSRCASGRLACMMSWSVA